MEITGVLFTFYFESHENEDHKSPVLVLLWISHENEDQKSPVVTDEL
jgi:hypothetical protein